MSQEQRRLAVVGIDFSSMSPDEVQAYVAAAMAPEPPKPQPDRLPHIRTRIPRKRGNTFYRVKYGDAENGSRTLCGAEAGLDFTWRESRNLRGQAVCEACLAIRTATTIGTD